MHNHLREVTGRASTPFMMPTAQVFKWLKASLACRGLEGRGDLEVHEVGKHFLSLKKKNESCPITVAPPSSLALEKNSNASARHLKEWRGAPRTSSIALGTWASSPVVEYPHLLQMMTGTHRKAQV